MPQSQSQGKVDSLEVLAKAQLHRAFTTAERKPLAKAPLGQLAFCGPSHDPEDPDNDPSKAEKSEGRRAESNFGEY